MSNKETFNFVVGRYDESGEFYVITDPIEKPQSNPGCEDFGVWNGDISYANYIRSLAENEDQHEWDIYILAKIPR